jgi:hypothetical protein
MLDKRIALFEHIDNTVAVKSFFDVRVERDRANPEFVGASEMMN